MGGIWREHPGWLTLGLTVILCGVGLLLGVPEMEILGVLLFGLVLTAVNSLKKGDR
jgi:hypothetical protein